MIGNFQYLRLYTWPKPGIMAENHAAFFGECLNTVTVSPGCRISSNRYSPAETLLKPDLGSQAVKVVSDPVTDGIAMSFMLLRNNLFRYLGFRNHAIGLTNGISYSRDPYGVLGAVKVWIYLTVCALK